MTARPDIAHDSRTQEAQAGSGQRFVSQRQPLLGVKNADGSWFHPRPSSKRKCPKCKRLMGWFVDINPDGTPGEEGRVCYSCPDVWWPWQKPKRKPPNENVSFPADLKPENEGMK